MSDDVLHVVAVARDPRTQSLRVTLSDGAVLVTAPHAPEVEGLLPGDVLDEARQRALSAAADRKAVAQRAMRLLSKRRYSRHRLADKLLASGFGVDVVERVLQQLLEQGLVDDAAFARAYCADQLVRRPVGRAWLLRGLRQQGVSADDARTGVDAALPAADELTLARQALRTRRAGRDDPAQAARDMRFLVARGFAPAVARQAALRERKGEQ